ncbi:MAG: hypothetical protein KAJ08_12400, partial [Deltaproteobacteria bacterium]|nr:hypothetical protein [Deltaproteobacteria bacterium]
ERKKIFFLKSDMMFTSITNKQIGIIFGGLSYSAVAKAYQRFSASLKKVKLLKKWLKKSLGKCPKSRPGPDFS